MGNNGRAKTMIALRNVPESKPLVVGGPGIELDASIPAPPGAINVKPPDVRLDVANVIEVERLEGDKLMVTPIGPGTCRLTVRLSYKQLKRFADEPEPVSVPGSTTDVWTFRVIDPTEAT